jgi:hypothetical protein
MVSAVLDGIEAGRSGPLLRVLTGGCRWNQKCSNALIRAGTFGVPRPVTLS